MFSGLNGKFHFCDLCISPFLTFYILFIFTISCFSPFYDFVQLIIFAPFAITIRPYSEITRRGDSQGRILIGVVVLPSFCFLWFCIVVFWIDFVSGRLHRRGDIIIDSRSPLSEPVSGSGLNQFHVGEITQGRIENCNSRSPLSEPVKFVFLKMAF